MAPTTVLFVRFSLIGFPPDPRELFDLPRRRQDDEDAEEEGGYLFNCTSSREDEW